jgi:hypothetical protein
MNLPITPHSRLDTQSIVVIAIAHCQVTILLYLSPQQAEPQAELPQLLTTVVKPSAANICLAFRMKYEQLSFNNLRDVCEQHR